MDVGDALRSLADLVDAIDDSDADVRDATIRTVHDDGRSTATLTVDIPADASGTAGVVSDTESGSTAAGSDSSQPAHVRRESSADDSHDVAGDAEAADGGPVAGNAEAAGSDTMAEDAETAADGHSAVSDRADTDRNSSGPPSDPPDTAEATATAGPHSQESDREDGVPCTRDGCEATFDSEHGMRIHRSKAHDATDVSADHERLRTVYDRESSFDAMRDALDVDVSAQTVRRWMMSAGIHTVDDGEATRADTSAAGSGDASQTTPDDGADARSDETSVVAGDDASETGPEEALSDDASTRDPDTGSDELAGDDEYRHPPGHDETDTADSGGGSTDRDGGDDEPEGERTVSEPTSRDGDGSEQAPMDDATGASRDTEAARPQNRRVLPGDEALPDGVTAMDLRSAVEEASTLYDVQQCLDLDRETAREVLAEYDLLELVHGRVADRHRREELKEEIDDRLRSNATPADSPSD